MTINYMKALNEMDVNKGFKIPDHVSVATMHGILNKWYAENSGSRKVFKILADKRMIGRVR